MNANGVLTGPDESATMLGMRNSTLDSSSVLHGTKHDGEELSSERQLNVAFPKEKTSSTPSRQEHQQQPQESETNGQAQELNQELMPFLDCSPTVPALAPPTTNTTTHHGVVSKAGLLSPFAVPSNRFYGNRTRLVHGRVRVVVAEKFLGDTKIYYDLQDKHDNTLRFPILMAVKKWKNRKYDMYDNSWDENNDHVNGSSKPSEATGDQQDATNNSNNKVGTLEKMLSFQVGKVSYKLCNASGAEESRISYRLRNPIMNKTGRKCNLVLLTDEGKSKLLTSKDFDDELKNLKAKNNGDRNNTNKNKAASHNNDTEQPQQLLHYLVSKIPDTRNADQQFALDFAGRGRQASTKNAQLTGAVAQHGVVLQMSKVDESVFHVDYRAPCTAFHAFAYALAQLDL